MQRFGAAQDPIVKHVMCDDMPDEGSETLHLVLCDDPQCAGKFVRLFHDKPSFQLIVAAAPTMSRNMCDGNMDNTRNGGVGRNLASSPWTLVDLVPPLLLVHEVS